MPVLTFTLHKTIDEKYYFRLRDISDRVLLTSRNYSALRKCVEDIYAIRCYRDYTIELQHNGCDGFAFEMKAAWGIMIAKSGTYTFRQRARFDMHLIEEAIHDAEIEDRCTYVRFVPVQPLRN